MDHPDIPPRVRERLLEILERAHQEHLREAIGWVVVCIDTESDEWDIAFASGVYGNDREAMEAAVQMDADDTRLGIADWKHVVAPIFSK